jgi:hypothetical protein
MNKLIFFLIIILGIVYLGNKYQIKNSSNYKNKLFQNTNTTVNEYFEVMNNHMTLQNYQKMSLHKKNDLSCLQNILNVLKRRSKFISMHSNEGKSKPFIGIFSSSTKQLSKIMDGLRITQQDFLDNQLPNGVILFYLLVNKKYINEHNQNVQLKYHFSDLLSNIIYNYKKSQKIGYILYPIENYYYNDPIVEILIEFGFFKINNQFDKVVFFKKYI